ncbi:cation diffusion facilitator family transporter [Acidomonas methanolica]|uniref:cation diffusion facilitator family transporter n=1 Tax=Acidomonas methanolica TaxID=437 RepID=UPI0005A6F5FD|nr:cation diffusion facilitator family transporter [Acidomonas methanolica]TCS29348.1 cobalt-zinc-cadmium efflux system protein [Acidomonas methanolica]
MPHDHTHDHDHPPAPGHRHDHGHDHGHESGHHHGHHHVPARFGAAFAVGMALNTIYIVGEVVWGLRAHALALLADAGHNLSDVLGLGVAWLTTVLARRSPSARFTYGLKRSTILSALGNAILILLVTGGIAWEAILRLLHPAPVAGWTVTIVAAIGIAVNGGTALLLMRGSEDDMNVRGAFLHMVYDALLALAVVLTGIAIALTGRMILDPLVSLFVSAVIIAGTWSFLRGALGMALDAVPAGIDPAAVTTALLGLDGVRDVHHLHIWALSTTETALTAHIVADPAPVSGAEAAGPDFLLKRAAEMLAARFDIDHPTLQIERTACAAHMTCPGRADAQDGPPLNGSP